jgi:hypothetical protein
MRTGSDAHPTRVVQNLSVQIQYLLAKGIDELEILGI